MIQQINLYPQNEAFSMRPIWLQPAILLLMLTLAIFVLTSFGDWQELQAMQQQRQSVQQALQTTTAEVLTLQAQLPSEQSHALLDQELQQSLKVLQSLSHIVELLADDQSDRTQGVSHYFSALVQEVDAAVWLRRIQIDTAGNRISLHGSSFKADAIPLLLQRLQTTEAFKRRHFARMSIVESKEVDGQVDFVVSSDPEKEKSDDN